MDKWFGLALFLLSSYEVVNGQCFLTIELNQFQNLHSLEIWQDPSGNDMLCCCDHLSPITCNAEHHSTDICEPLCDTFFVVNLECEDSAPCPISMITDVTKNSAPITDVNYKFYFDLSNSAIDSVAIEIEMRDSDVWSCSNEIDTFDIKATFPSDNQEQVITGNRSIATITLTYDIVCIEPNACNATVASSDVIDSCAVIDTITSVVTSTTVVKATPMITSLISYVTSCAVIDTTTSVVTSTKVVKTSSMIDSSISYDTSFITTTSTDNLSTTLVVTSTQLTIATSTIITSTHSTTTKMQSLTTTATLETGVTLSAMSRAITITSTVPVNSPSKDSSGQQPAGSRDSTLLVWMSLCILFALLTIVAVTISIWLGCLLMKKNHFKVNTKRGNVDLLQTKRFPPMDNPVYELQETSGRNNTRNVLAGYSTLPSDLYANISAPEDDIYATCGPGGLHMANSENYRTRQLDESEAAPYEIPITLVTSK